MRSDSIKSKWLSSVLSSVLGSKDKSVQQTNKQTNMGPPLLGFGGQRRRKTLIHIMLRNVYLPVDIRVGEEKSRVWWEYKTRKPA